ncbi:hypothetical protein BCF59_0461 [Mycoplasmopsis mustelae]|uniref:Uncharacterized protein n=1 Tax=Mycoplasmopsis mustelae TaxID=171289 RepID=A0A4R7UDD0_9BACT|nr:hypothetical protein [Mycoplasmopsis mustelae]TDV24488.1 hypothetical protein BCF59_0461 [Mycoplasmopsis mustelae]
MCSKTESSEFERNFSKTFLCDGVLKQLLAINTSKLKSRLNLEINDEMCQLDNIWCDDFVDNLDTLYSTFLTNTYLENLISFSHFLNFLKAYIREIKPHQQEMINMCLPFLDDMVEEVNKGITHNKKWRFIDFYDRLIFIINENSFLVNINEQSFKKFICETLFDFIIVVNLVAMHTYWKS